MSGRAGLLVATLPPLLLLGLGALLLGPWRQRVGRDAVRLAAGALLGLGLLLAAVFPGGPGELLLAEGVLLGGCACLALLEPALPPRSAAGLAGALLVGSAGLLALACAVRVEGLLLGPVVAVWGLSRLMREAGWGEPAARERALASAVIALGLSVLGVGCLLTVAASGRIAPLALAAQAPRGAPWLLGLGGCFLVLGLAAPLGALPFMGWVPAVSERAPAALGGWVTTAFPAAAAAALARCLLGLGALQGWVEQGLDPRALLAPLGVATSTLALLVALRSRSLQRLLAWLAVAQGGVILLALAYFPPGGDRLPAMFVIVVGAGLLANAAGFALAAALGEGRPGGAGLERLVGLASRSPGLAVALGVVLASHAGFPCTVGFLARLRLLLAGAAAQAPPSYLLLAALDLLLAALVALRLGRLLLHPGPEASPEPAWRGAAWLGAALTLGVLWLGLFPPGWGAP